MPRRRSRSSRSSRSRQAQTQLILREHEMSLEVQGQLILTRLFDSLVNDESTFVDRLNIIGPVISTVEGELSAIAAGRSGLGIDAQEAIMEINNYIIRFASNESYSPMSFERDCNSALARIRDNRSIVATAAASVATPTRFTGVSTLTAIYMYMFWQQLQAIIQGIITVRNSGLGRIMDVGGNAVVAKMIYNKIWNATAPYVAKNNVTFPEVQQMIALAGMMRSKKLHVLGNEILDIATAVKSNDKKTLRRLLGTGQAGQLLPGEEEVLLTTNMPQQLLLPDGKNRLGQRNPRPMKLAKKAKKGAVATLNTMFEAVKKSFTGDMTDHLKKAYAADVEKLGHELNALAATANRVETLCFTTLISMMALLVFFLFRKFMSKRRFREVAAKARRQRQLNNFRMKKSRKASRKRRSAKKKASRKRRSAKRKASRKRRSAKRKANRKASRKRKSVKRKASRKRKSAKRKASRKRKSAKRKASRKRKSAKRKASRKRRSAKKKASRKRKSAKRKASRKRKRCPPGCVKRR